MRRDELIVAAALVAACLLTIGALIPRFVADAPLGGGLSPAFMPYVAAALATLAALFMLNGALRPRAPEQDSPPLTLAHFRFLGAAAVVLGASYALMSLFGYVLGGVALVAGFLKLARVPPLRVAIVAVAAPVTLWLLFVGLLGMPLP